MLMAGTGQMYYEGHGVPVDHSKAIEMFLKAETEKYWMGACNIGIHANKARMQS